MASSKALLPFLLLIVAVAAFPEQVGYYVPRGFYTIDKYGQVSPFTPLTRSLRLPRNVYTSSSSSSSSSGGYGSSQSFSVSGAGPGYVDPYASLVGLPPIVQQPVYPADNYPHSGGSGGTFQAQPVIFNRFGDEGGVSGVGIQGTSSGGNGVFSSSSSTIGSDGKVHYTAHTGKI